MHRQLKCPICGEELDNLSCPGEDCSFSEDYTILRNSTTIDEVIQQLVSAGAYINTNTETLIIPGKTADSRYLLSGEKAAMLASFLRTTFGMTQRTMQANTALSLLNRIRHEYTDIPWVETSGDYPLMHRVDGHLTYLGRTIHNKYYYMGGKLTPQAHNGIFDEWVDTFRWATKEDRAILRAWLLSLFAQPEVPPGRFPALLLATYSGSSVGKTETATMISNIFGRMMSRFWSSKVAENADRELLSGEHRFFCADNLYPERNSNVIEGGLLSEFITKGAFESKRLYSTGGTVKIKKPTIDMLTANFPILALDLLQRVVVVGLVNKKVKGNGDWTGTWMARRKELLEEGMWIVQENSKNSKVLKDYTCGYPDFRYPLWYSVAVECNGGVFNPYPSDSCISCPVDVIVDPDEIVNRPVGEAIEVLQNIRRRASRIFIRQAGDLTEEKFCSIVRRWSKNYKIKEVNGEQWIVSKQT